MIFKIIILSLIMSLSPNNMQAKELSFLKVDGRMIVNEKGQEVLLGGFNLGNWLLLEPWMLGFNIFDEIQSGKDIFDMFEKRFGEAKAKELYRTYVDNYVTEQDIKYLAGLGINFVRIPFWYRALFDKKYSEKELFYLDKLIKWCKKYKIYVLIDLHGAPGGQSQDSPILGERSDNRLWDNKENIQKTVTIWQTIAKKYKNEKTVIGYDLLNEAMGAPSIHDLMDIYDLLYKAIRKIDTRHIIFIEDALKGVYRLPQPEERGWDNVCYSFHFYPTFGQPDNMDRVKEASEIVLPSLRAAQEQLNVPFHIGEFNSMTMTKGGVEFLRWYMRIFMDYGWSWNIWNYKRINDDEEDMWGLTGRMDDWVVPDIRKASFEEIKRVFKGFNSKSLKKNVIYEAMLKDFFKELKKAKISKKSKNIVCVPLNGFILRERAGEGIRIEWGKKKVNYGFWNEGDVALWKIKIDKKGVYKIIMDGGTGSDQAKVSLLIGHYKYNQVTIDKTLGGWQGYKKIELGNIQLDKGTHVLKIRGEYPESGVINLRSLELAYLGDRETETLDPVLEDRIVLTPLDLYELKREKSLCVEWQNNPPNIGYLSGGESFSFKIDLPASSDYDIKFDFATPNPNSKFKIIVNEKIVNQVGLPFTGAWDKYTIINGGKAFFQKGENIITFEAVSDHPENTGNLRHVFLEKK
ncbi:MAG: cellulase family glycosylhydrolase [Spirochaetes bacterium]|nr:cellulase family glycosylhydrolase [Spirochaetota bacterium]